jgi:hypothetical protein
MEVCGKVISDTYAGKNYVGPEKALTDLNAIFAKTPISRSLPFGEKSSRSSMRMGHARLIARTSWIFSMEQLAHKLGE